MVAAGAAAAAAAWRQHGAGAAGQRVACNPYAIVSALSSVLALFNCVLQAARVT